MRENIILIEDLEYIYNHLTEKEKDKISNSTILITGCGGFLGYYFMHFFNRFINELSIKKIIALENFLTGTKDWLDDLVNQNNNIELHEFNVITDDVSSIPGSEEADIIIHMASIASPMFYRKYPVETIDANITGLRRLFDFYKDKNIKGLLFFSSSEIYGDPFPEYIPTKEDYRGNVNTLGPRACYDEAKRFGETMCWIFNEQFNIPVAVARPFNNYGPGMNINDKRLPADFAKAIIEGRNIDILSDGTPTRTFCYIADAITGYFKVLLYPKLEAFNIGIDKPEISVKEFSELFLKHGREIWNYKGEIKFNKSEDKAYMADNPNRRCPDITKARKLLNYNPSIYVDKGIGRYLKFLKTYNGKLL